MAYAKKAASEPRGRGKVHHSEAHSKTEEQEKLLDFIRYQNDRKLKNHPEERIRKPLLNPERRPQLIKNFQEPWKYSKPVQKEETLEEKIERIKTRLDRLESPFNWNPVQAKRGGEFKLLDRIQEKDEEILDERKFKWRNFILQLVMSYELYKIKDLAKALDKLQNLKKTLANLSTCREWLYLGAKEALEHVVQASLAFIFMEQNLINETEKLLHEILPQDMMKRAGKAAIHGVRAAVFMEYGHQGNINALEEAKQAVQLDPATPEWFFLVGKSLRRIRRMSQCHELVTFEEVDAFRKAEESDRNNPLYKVYLAQVIGERAFSEHKKFDPKFGSDKFKKLDKANQAASFWFKKAREMRPDCPHMLARCAYGMMRLPARNQVNLKFIRESVDKAIELAPNNSFAHHVKGLYFERFHVEAETALAEVKIAADLGNFGAAMDLVRMHHHLKGCTIIEELEAVAESYGDPREVQVACSQAGSYLLFIKKDIIEALKYYIKVINIDPDSYAMKSHKPMFIRMKNPVNMFDVLLEELDSRTDWKSFSAQDKKVLKEFRILARRHDTRDKGTNSERLTVEKILELSRKKTLEDAENIEKRKAKEKERSKKRWRGKIRGSGKRNKSSSGKGKNDAEKPPERRDYGGSRRMGGGSFGNGVKNERNRNSSISSVDSDYQRDSRKFGSRGFFFGGSSENLKSADSVPFNPTRDPFRREPIDSRFYSSKLTMGEPKSFHSRDSSVCSTSSIENERGAIDLRYQKAIHKSRFLQTHTGPLDEKNQLSVENLQKFDLMDPNIFKPRCLSMVSLSSSESGNQSSASEGMSVMDRLKESYRMLNYKKNENEPKQENQGKKKKKFQKSESLQSLDQQQQNPVGPKKFANKQKFQRSDSTQSLNVQQPFKNRFADGYRPAFTSRDSSVESSRSLSFMPIFARKSSGSESEKG